MKILYNSLSGKIFARIEDGRWEMWAFFKTRMDENGKYWILKPDGTDNVHLPLTLLDLTEDEINKSLCRDILYVRDKTDSDGDQKYSIKNGKIEEKVGWEEEIDIRAAQVL